MATDLDAHGVTVYWVFNYDICCQGFRQKKISGGLKKNKLKFFFKVEITPLMSLSTLKCLILLLNALTLHLSLINFQNQKKTFQRNSS
jgi:hypothetical protein